MSRTYRPARPEEHHDLIRFDFEAFGDRAPDDTVRRFAAHTPVDELRVLEDGDGIVGGLHARSRGVWWGGRIVPAGQVSGLWVPIEHRGRGAGSELLRAYLKEVAEGGAAISTLFPATAHLYRRAGYAYSGTWALYEADARHLPWTVPNGYKVRRVNADDPTPFIERLTDWIGPLRNGQVDRDDQWWRSRILNDRGGMPRTCLLVDGPEGPDGWIVLTTEEDVSASVSLKVDVRDWAARSRGGWQALLAVVAGTVSLGGRVVWHGPEPEPLVLLLREQDVSQIRQFRWMTRILDVERAFSARGWPKGANGSLVVEVTDDVLPPVAGTWELSVADGGGHAARTHRPAHVTTGGEGLSMLWSGYIDAGALAELGIAEGLTPQDVELLRAMHAGPGPWSPDFY